MRGVYPHLAASSSKTTPDALKLLLQYYPDAIGRRTKFAIAFALFSCSERRTYDAVKVLTDAYPNGVGRAVNARILHFACGESRASFAIICLLLEKYPEGVREKSVESMLPLHFAAANRLPLEGSLLVESYPEAIADRDRHSRMPLHHALENGSDEVILYLLEQDRSTVKATGTIPTCRCIWRWRKPFRGRNHFCLSLMRINRVDGGLSWRKGYVGVIFA